MEKRGQTKTRTFMTAAEAAAYAEEMGKRVTGMSFGSDSVKVTVRPARFEDIMPERMPRTEQQTTATGFNMNGSIRFKPGNYGTK